MKAWSDEDGWIEIEVTWSGSMKTPLPGIGGIERRGSYLTDGAPSTSKQSQEFPSQAEMRGKTDYTGLQVRAPLPAWKCSTGCGRFVSPAGMNQGYKRCNQCRREGRGGRHRAKEAA